MNAVDTNVLIYAYDESSPAKQERARALLTSMEDGVLLWQVACEFIAASRKLVAQGTELAVAWDRLDEIRGAFRVVVPTEGVLRRAREISSRTRAHFWDAMIFAACSEAGVTRLYTKDVPGGGLDALEIVNPSLELVSAETGGRPSSCR